LPTADHLAVTVDLEKLAVPARPDPELTLRVEGDGRNG